MPDPPPDQQTSLVLVKPDGVQRGLIGEILSRFERAGLLIIGSKMLQISPELARAHYFDLEARRGPDVLRNAVAMLTSGVSMAVAISGPNALERVKRLVGATDPARAHPGTIRSDYRVMTMVQAKAGGVPLLNQVHCSSPDDPAEAAYELGLYFTADDLVSPYERAVSGTSAG